MRTDYSTLELTLDGSVADLRLARPDSANALTSQMWREFREALRLIDEEPAVRVVVLSGRGKHFCAGIDLATLSEFGDDGGSGDPRVRV